MLVICVICVIVCLGFGLVWYWCIILLLWVSVIDILKWFSVMCFISLLICENLVFLVWRNLWCVGVLKNKFLILIVVLLGCVVGFICIVMLWFLVKVCYVVFWCFGFEFNVNCDIEFIDVSVLLWKFSE